MNSIGYFEIQATDTAKAVEFYTNVFDWKFVKEMGFPIDYRRIENAGMNGGLMARPVKTPPTEYGTNAYTCSIEVADFDATAKVILENGGQVAMAKFEIPGRCWQGYFLDTDKNVFGIFQVID